MSVQAPCESGFRFVDGDLGLGLLLLLRHGCRCLHGCLGMENGRNVIIREVYVAKPERVGLAAGKVRVDDAKDAWRVSADKQRNDSPCRKTAFEKCFNKRNCVLDIVLVASGVYVKLVYSVGEQVGRKVLVVEESEQFVSGHGRVRGRRRAVHSPQPQ